MSTIPQRELRNNISDVLRRAERGERLTITVGGRPVAELGPVSRPIRPASADRLARILADTPVDAGWRDNLSRARDGERADAVDPWAE